MDRLRLGLVGPLPPPAGGMANQTRQLAGLLDREGIEVRIVCTNAPYRPIWIGRVRGIRGIFRLVPFLRALSTMSREVHLMHVMANSGWAWFLCAAPAIRAAVRHGVPVIVNYRGGLAREFLAKSSARVIPTLRRVDALIVPSRFLQEVFAQYGVQAEIIPNVVNLEVFRPRLESSASARPHVVITRNLEALYGIDTAIRAAAIVRKEVPGLVMSIAGSGPERERLEGLTAELGLADAIRFTGRLEVAEVAALYAQADLVLNPSRADNTPNALLEAAACGVPILSTNVGGVPYLVEHGRSAWLVPPDDPELMAQGISQLLRNFALRATLRANGLALASSCSWGTVKQQWLDLYDRVARQRSRQMLHAPQVK
jgi:glycosyltransferase involved in cell wall biosynthesis